MDMEMIENVVSFMLLVGLIVLFVVVWALGLSEAIGGIVVALMMLGIFIARAFKKQ
jgi:hypothetical protein